MSMFLHRMVDLGPLLSAHQLAEQAVDLNLMLMRCVSVCVWLCVCVEVKQAMELNLMLDRKSVV